MNAVELLIESLKLRIIPREDFEQWEDELPESFQEFRKWWHSRLRMSEFNADCILTDVIIESVRSFQRGVSAESERTGDLL